LNCEISIMTGSNGNVSVGGTSPATEPHHPDVESKTLGESEVPSPGHGSEDAASYGEEGTNKTIPEPKPDNAPSDEPGHTRHIPKSPYTRG
jgi:hypothetical protein